jgi:hypothetical protein
MNVFALIMYVCAFLCALVAAFVKDQPKRVSLGWLGFAFFVLPFLVSTADAVL